MTLASLFSQYFLGAMLRFVVITNPLSKIPMFLSLTPGQTPVQKNRVAFTACAYAGAIMVVSLIGGISGSLLLLATSNAAFSRLVPWLLLVATSLFAFSGQISRAVAAAKAKVGLGTRAADRKSTRLNSSHT